MMFDLFAGAGGGGGGATRAGGGWVARAPIGTEWGRGTSCIGEAAAGRALTGECMCDGRANGGWPNVSSRRIAGGEELVGECCLCEFPLGRRFSSPGTMDGALRCMSGLGWWLPLRCKEDVNTDGGYSAGGNWTGAWIASAALGCRDGLSPKSG